VPGRGCGESGAVVARYLILPKSQKDAAVQKHPNRFQVHSSHQSVLYREFGHGASITYPSNTQIRWLAAPLYACTRLSFPRAVQITEQHQKQNVAVHCATRRKDPGVLRLRSEQE
jgi:hypothetical protein